MKKNKNLSAFVIMPIGAKETEEYMHFLTIYNEFIKPVFEEYKFSTKRADEISETGSINTSVITHIATDDIVIADLTNLNPNVFYELGIRHTLKSNGTLLIIDSSKSTIPSDLSNYRNIKYDSSAPAGAGLAELRKNLSKFIETFLNNKQKLKSDNPVHDVLKDFNKFFRVKESLNNEDYKEHDISDGENFIDAMNNLIDEAIIDAEEKLIPKDIIKNAELAVKEENLLEFLGYVKEFINLKTFLPSEREYLDLYYYATRIDARSKITKSILELGLRVFPESATLLNPYISYLAHSSEINDREKAKKMVEDVLNISIENDKIEIANLPNANKYPHLLSWMLDAYHRDGQHERALKITSSIVEKYPENTVARRNHARAMEKQGGFSIDELINEYKKAIMVPNPSDSSALWYAGTLAEAGQNTNALEAYLYACTLDFDEAECFARLSVFLSNIVQPRSLADVSHSEGQRVIPKSINRDSVVKCIMLTMDCPNYGVDQKFLCENAMRNIGLKVEELEDLKDDREDEELTRIHRRQFIEPLYNELKSQITKRKENDNEKK